MATIATPANHAAERAACLPTAALGGNHKSILMNGSAQVMYLVASIKSVAQLSPGYAEMCPLMTTP